MPRVWYQRRYRNVRISWWISQALQLLLIAGIMVLFGWLMFDSGPS